MCDGIRQRQMHVDLFLELPLQIPDFHLELRSIPPHAAPLGTAIAADITLQRTETA